MGMFHGFGPDTNRPWHEQERGGHGVGSERGDLEKKSNELERQWMFEQQEMWVGRG